MGMKNFLRCLLVVICISWGYGSVAATSHVSVDTVDVCVHGAPKSMNLLQKVKGELFPMFRAGDSLSILRQGTDTLKYNVSYQIDSFQFSGDYVSSDGMVALEGYRDQYVLCEVFYTRTIQFNFGESFFRKDGEDANLRMELAGLKEGEYPQAQVKSARTWQCVARIKKSLSQVRDFAIEGDTCLADKVILNVPEPYTDMQCTWLCEEYVGVSDIYAPEVTITRKELPFLTTDVRCVIRGCDNRPVSSNIRIRSNHTPASTLTIDIEGGDCLSTAATGTVPVTVSNEVPGVRYIWIRELVPSALKRNLDNQTERFDYPIVKIEDFTVVVATYGGCTASYTSKTVHRKLDSNIGLQVTDSSPTTGAPITQFTIETVPPLPNMSLRWQIPVDFSASMIDNDKIFIYKMGALKNPTNISVVNQFCPSGSISKEITVK